MKPGAVQKADLVYLDSFDLSFDRPFDSAIHCIRELLAILPALGSGSLLLVDDTPADPSACPDEERAAASAFLRRYGMTPGKGMFIDLLLQRLPGVRKIHHRYQVLYQFS